jgi:DNA repair exonuclease SbcCD nuclease subunit
MEPCYPIPSDAAYRLQLDYLALGHYHSAATYDGGSGVVRMAYSGSHEPTSFGERNSGNVLLVDIDAPGAPPRIDTIPSHVLDWRILDRNVRSAGDLAAVAAELAAITDPEHTLVRCALHGDAALPDDDLERLAETIDSRFLFGEFDTEDLEIDTGGDTWVDDLPAGYLRRTGALLRERATQDATAAAALAELRLVWRGVRP